VVIRDAAPRSASIAEATVSVPLVSNPEARESEITPPRALAWEDEERCRESAVSIRGRSVIECDRRCVPFAAEVQVTCPRRPPVCGDEMADVGAAM
jgi:hypothetical protein